MNKKTKQRILGTLVMAGLIVILLPLFQNEKEGPPSEAAAIKAPPFPDQPVQVTADMPTSDGPLKSPDAPITSEASSSMPQQPTLPADAQVNPTPPTNVSAQAAAQTPAQTPVADQAVTPAQAPAQAPVQVTAPLPVQAPVQVPVQVPAQAAMVNPLSEHANSTARAPMKTVTSPVAPLSLSQHPQRAASTIKTTKKTKTKKVIKIGHVKKITKTNIKTNIKANISKTHPIVSVNWRNNNGLVDLKNPIWAVQLGSFKDKTYALRLVNRLRARGYSAFIQYISNAFGDNTRVFVGPENQQSQALALADKLENEIHIRGVIISYKPLAL